MLSRAAAALFVVSVALGVPTEARAYCFSAACADGAEQFCDQDATLPSGCHLIRWKTGCTGFAVQKDGGPNLSADLLESLARGAFDNWQNVDCGGGQHPGVYSVNMGLVNCNKVEYNKNAGNQNVIIVRSMAWPHPPQAGHDIALTTVTFDPGTGELLDADMELNAAGFIFTTSDSSVDFDTLSVLQHETGHFIGMAHSYDDSATMRPEYPPPSMALALRTLSQDDINGVCTIYPPDPTVAPQCNPLGRHGFSPDCNGSQTEGTCSYSPGAAPTGFAPFLLLLGAALLVRRRA
jgi:uncharacterized protein (TIGR03382 family)